jgi:AcrR family transcriptional regulator
MNMCSAGDESAMTQAMLDGDDRSTPARIRDAALACFAERGVRPTTVRQIAERAGVSAALVIHHFGSKERLRGACDRRVAALIRERKLAVMRAGSGLDPLSVLRDQAGDPPIQRYLARTLAEGTPEVAGLVDEMIDDAERYVREGMERGVLRRSDDPRGVAAVLTLWSLGAMVLHEHVERVLGVDLTGPAEAHASNPAYVGPALELLSHGLVMPHWFDAIATNAGSDADVAPPGTAGAEEEA